jgi:arylsulfatase A-like enzyme
MHHPDEVDLPRHGALDLDRRPWWHRASLEGSPRMENESLRKFREKSSRTPLQSEKQMRHLIANYYGMISLVDHQVGRIRIALRESGLDKNTILVYSTDHGDWLGDHGLLLKGPMPYEGLLRVGLLFEGPGVPAGKLVEDPVSTLDLAQTFCDYAQTSMDVNAHSRSLRPMIETDIASRDFALSEWDLRPSRSGVELQLRTVRTKRYKLSLDLLSGAGEMYDLQEDPDEMDNRFSDPAMVAVQKELTDMIASRPDDAVAPLPQIGMA